MPDHDRLFDRSFETHHFAGDERRAATADLQPARRQGLCRRRQDDAVVAPSPCGSTLDRRTADKSAPAMRRSSCRARRALELVRSSRQMPMTWPPGLLALGLRKRRPHRHLVAEPAGMGADAVCNRAHRRSSSSTSIPAYRVSRARIRAQQGRLQGAGPGARASRARDYIAQSRAIAPEIDVNGEPGRLDSARLPQLKHVDPHRATKPGAGMLTFDEVMRARRPGASRCGSMISRAALDPDEPINIQFTCGTTGLAEGRDAHRTPTSSTTPASSPRRHGADRAMIGCASRCRSITASAWCWACLGCATTGAAMVFPGEGFDAGATRCRRSRSERCTALMACRPCSSRCSITRTSPTSTCRRCAPASWPARPARSR